MASSTSQPTSEDLQLALKLVASMREGTTNASQLAALLAGVSGTTSETTITMEEGDKEPDLTYDRIFGTRPGSDISGKEYLQRYHSKPRSSGYEDYLHIQRQIRLLFTNPGDVKVPAILFCNYKRNKKAKEECLEFIKARMGSLSGLHLFHKDGRIETFRWKEEELFRYFLEHKNYFQTMYRKKKEEMDCVACINHPDVEDQRVQQALLEAPPLQEEPAIAEEDIPAVADEACGMHKRTSKRGKGGMQKKKKVVQAMDLGFWSTLS